MRVEGAICNGSIGAISGSGSGIISSQTCSKVIITNMLGVQLGALILRSPFTSVRTVVQYGHGHSTLGRVAASFITDCFKTFEWIQQVEAPLLIVHGMLDELVLVAQAETVLRAAGSTIKQLHVAPGRAFTIYNNNS